MNPIDCGIYPATFEGKQGFVVKTRHGTCIFQTNRGNWRDDEVSEKELTIIEEQDNGVSLIFTTTGVEIKGKPRLFTYGQ